MSSPDSSMAVCTGTNNSIPGPCTDPHTSVTPQKPSPFASDIIQVRVGPASKSYTAHKAILSKIPFFDKCLGNGFQETERNSISLPDDDPEAFEIVLQHVYSQLSPDLCVKFSLNTDDAPTVQHLLDAYVLADKLSTESLENKIVDTFRLHYQEYTVHWSSVVFLRESGLDDSLLRKMMLVQLAHRIRFRGWDQHIDHMGREGYDLISNVEHGGEDTLDLMKAIADSYPEYRPSHCINVCRWHKHATTPKCDESEGSGKGGGAIVGKLRVGGSFSQSRIW